MECKYSDIIRNDYKIYLEPILATRAFEMAQKIGCKTRSKYIRYAVIRALIADGVELSDKFNSFINRELRKGITSYK